MELRQLRYFVSVAQELNFTRAAQKVRVAQPALSRQIRQLEDEIGVRLLERNRRSTHLTDAGRAFLPEACALLEQSARAVQVAQKANRAAAATLKIGYVWGLFHSLVPGVMERFRCLLPDVPVHLFDLTATEQAGALVEGTLDAGFIGLADDAKGPGLARRKVGACSFVAALPERHASARKKRLPLLDLAEQPFLMIAEESYPGASHLVSQACELAGFRPKIAQHVRRGFTILGLVAGGGAVALLPESLCTLPHPGVVFRRLREPVGADLYVAWRPSLFRPERDTFLRLFAAAR